MEWKPSVSQRVALWLGGLGLVFQWLQTLGKYSMKLGVGDGLVLVLAVGLLCLAMDGVAFETGSKVKRIKVLTIILLSVIGIGLLVNWASHRSSFDRISYGAPELDLSMAPYAKKDSGDK